MTEENGRRMKRGHLRSLREITISMWRSGWVRSWATRQAVDADGRPLPWMTYPFIYFMETRRSVLAQLACFEYGSGNSTLWWSQHVSTVDAVESDPRWTRQLQARLPRNAGVVLRPAESREYVDAAGVGGIRYDLIVVDGRQRVACMKAAEQHLTPTGVVVLDNAYRPHYVEGVEWLLGRGFRRLEFSGMVPITGVIGETSIFYRAENCLEI